ncbi:MFS transporter [Kribbella sp. NPDC059898]|uniref:MFS transporter n=1 Tax=Kribbella sp. NPDC059898 TaxID=3346995 RepID=UPI003664AA02
MPPRGERARLLIAATLVVGGWGANQFTPLSVAYRLDQGWSTLRVVAMFTTYLLGLVPALLLGCRAADRFGVRRVVRLALALTAVASCVLALSVVSEAAVYVSRLSTGVATGVIVSAAAAWLGQSSQGSGTRYAVYATGTGFAFGPLAAGAMVEWLPHPLVLPPLVHAVLALLLLRATANLPETAGRRAVRQHVSAERWSAVTHPRFVGVVLPASPAVFAAVTVSYVVLPPLVVDRIHDYAPLFSGLVAAVTLTVGLLVQPAAARIDRPGSARATLIAMATVVIGLLVGSVAVDRASPVAVVAAAVVLGAGYGLTLESGLAEIGRLASPSALPTAAALFQGVAHSGFLAPLVLAISARSASYQEMLVVLALVGLVFLTVAAVYSRKHGHPEPSSGERLTSWDE